MLSRLQKQQLKSTWNGRHWSKNKSWRVAALGFKIGPSKNTAITAESKMGSWQSVGLAHTVYIYATCSCKGDLHYKKCGVIHDTVKYLPYLIWCDCTFTVSKLLHQQLVWYAHLIFTVWAMGMPPENDWLMMKLWPAEIESVIITS